MHLRLTSVAAAGTAAILLLVSACSDDPATEPGSGGAAGATSGGSSGAGGTPAAGSGGAAAGVSGGGAGGATAGTTGGTAAGTSGAAAGGASAGLGGSAGATGGGSAGATGGGGAGGTAAGAGGSSGSGSGGTIPATFDTLKLVIEQTAPTPCNAADCHGGEHHPLKLAVDDGLYTRLTTYMSKNCGNIPVVTPGDPTRSALVMLLKGPCGMTPQMPNGCTPEDGNCLPDDYIAAIEQWVQNGAPQ